MAPRPRAVAPLPLLLAALAAAGCGDVRDRATDVPSFARDCPPGQEAKGRCDPAPPPPEGPVEPSLPDPAPRGGLVTPNRMAVTPVGNLLVADPRTKSIVYVHAGTLQPTASLELGYRPGGVAILENRIYVGNTAAGAIDVFASEDGSFVTTFGVPDLTMPSDLAADEAAGLLFVSDVRAGRVFVYDDGNSLVNEISSRGPGTDQLLAPQGLALDRSAGQVLISDWGDFASGNASTASVKIFTYDGTYVDAISGGGTCGMLGCSGGFSRPGSPLSANGRVYVPDVILAQVLAFDRTTKAVVGTLGGRPGLRLPTDVVLLGNEDLFVTSTRNGEIVSFPGAAR